MNGADRPFHAGIKQRSSLSLEGNRIQLVRLTLTDDGPITMPDGSDVQQPDVICLLRTCEARQLADRLIELADQARRTPTVTR